MLSIDLSPVSEWQDPQLQGRHHAGHLDGPHQTGRAPQHCPGHHAAVQDRPGQAKLQGRELLRLPGRLGSVAGPQQHTHMEVPRRVDGRFQHIGSGFLCHCPRNISGKDWRKG